MKPAHESDPFASQTALPNPANRRSKDRSLVGPIGLVMVAVATVGSPACAILPCPLLLLVPIGLIGLLVSFVGLFYRPRWCGAVGLIVGILCLAYWIGLFWLAIGPSLKQMRQYNISLNEHTTLLMRSQAAAEMIELRRRSDGTPPASLAAAGVTGENLVDPWNRPFRYVIDPATPRGYQLITDGKDGLPGTEDDIDLISLPRLGFELQPIGGGRRTGSQNVPPSIPGR